MLVLVLLIGIGGLVGGYLLHDKIQSLIGVVKLDAEAVKNKL